MLAETSSDKDLFTCSINDVFALIDYCETVGREADYYRQQFQKTAEFLSRIEKTTQLLEKRVEELFTMVKRPVSPEKLQ